MKLPSVVIRAVVDHAANEIKEAREKRAGLLEEVAELGRQIATLESYVLLAAEHAAAESNSNAEPTPPLTKAAK